MEINDFFFENCSIHGINSISIIRLIRQIWKMNLQIFFAIWSTLVLNRSGSKCSFFSTTQGKTIDRELLIKHQQSQAQLHQSSRGGDGGMHHQTSSTPAAKMRPQKLSRPRPKTIHVETGSVDLSETSSLSSRGKKGSNSNLTGKYPWLYVSRFFFVRCSINVVSSFLCD